MKRWRGLVDLLRDGFVAGTGALERAQKEGAAVPFAVLEAVPVVRLPARAVHGAYDAAVGLVYASLRVAGQAVGRGLDETLAAFERPRRGHRSRPRTCPPDSSEGRRRSSRSGG